MMERECLDILQQELEIPKEVWQKAETAFDALPERRENTRKQIKMGGFTKAAAMIALACLLIPGGTVMAKNLLNAYWQRMAGMNEQEIRHLYETQCQTETTLYSRELTEEELGRYQSLRQAFLEGRATAQTELMALSQGEEPDGDRVMLDEATCTWWLPERRLTDEELLVMIDYAERSNYSVREVNQIGYGKKWRERMEQMTMQEVDEVYFILYSNKNDTSGGSSRPLSEAEEARYQELLTQYEEDGLYTAASCAVVVEQKEVTGNGLEICIQDGNYHLPERELTEEELLLMIDWRHKGAYCLERLNKEVEMGIREAFPHSPYDLERTQPAADAPALSVEE